MKADKENSHPPENEAALFSSLIWRLAVETRAFLGEKLHPEIESLEPRLDLASHSIDTIEMLRKRTEGTRTDSETEMLDGILGQLRMDYLAVQKRLESSPPEADREPEQPNQETCPEEKAENG